MKDKKKICAGLLALTLTLSAMPAQAVNAVVSLSSQTTSYEYSQSARKLSAVTGDMLSVDFTDGTAKDNSQTANTLTSVGTPTIAANSTVGKNVATFNGENAYSYAFDTDKYSKMATTVSIECTFKLNEINADGEYDIFSNQQSGGLGIGLENGRLQFYCNVDGTYYQPNAEVETGKWYHVVGTYDGEIVKLYINGILVDTRAVEGKMKFTSNEDAMHFVIGGDSSTDGVEFLSKVEVANANLFSSVLSDEQIEANYNSIFVKDDVEVPAADMLDVNFKNGSADDTSETKNNVETIGSPVVADDTDLNCKVATFNGSYDAFKYPFDATKYSKMTNAVTIEATFKYNESPESGEYDIFSNQQSGGMGIGVDGGILQFFCNVNGTYIQPNYKIEAGKWYNVIGVHIRKM